MSHCILHGAAHSLATDRVGIALNLKGASFQEAFLDLRAGARHGLDFRRLNPQGLALALIAPDCIVVT